MSDSFIYSVGLQNVGSYQVSGQPFLSSSITVPANSAAPLEIQFDQVTKFVIIRNETDSAGDIRVGFFFRRSCRHKLCSSWQFQSLCPQIIR